MKKVKKILNYYIINLLQNEKKIYKTTIFKSYKKKIKT